MSKFFIIYLVLFLCPFRAIAEEVKVIPESGPLGINEYYILKQKKDDNTSIKLNENSSGNTQESATIQHPALPVKSIEAETTTDQHQEVNSHNEMVSENPRYKSRGRIRIGLLYNSGESYEDSSGYIYDSNSINSVSGKTELDFESNFGLSLEFFMNTQSFFTIQVGLNYEPNQKIKSLQITSDQDGNTYDISTGSESYTSISYYLNLVLKATEQIYVPIGLSLATVNKSSDESALNLKKNVGLQTGLGFYLGEKFVMEILYKFNTLTSEENDMNSQTNYYFYGQSKNFNASLKYIF